MSRWITMWTIGLTVIFGAAAFFAFADFLLFQKVFYYFDFEVQWMPFHQFVHAAWASGQSALWNPYIMLGFPQHGEAQVGVFYPINLLLHQLPNQPYAISVSVYLHCLIALLSTYGLARAVGLRRLAAVHGALCFGFSGFFIAELTNYNISLVAAYLPLKLFLITRYFTNGRVQYLLFFALASGAELLISHANMSFITSATAALYFVVCALVHRGHLLRDFSYYAMFSLLAIGLACIQLVPTLEFVTHSDRSGGISYEMITSYSQSFSQYLTAFFPMMFGTPSLGYNGQHSFEEQYFFVGTYGVLLALFGVAALIKRRDQRFVACLAVVGLIAFLLSLGSNNPFFDLYRLLVETPGFNFFRAPARWSLVPALAVAILSAYGLQTLMEHMQRRRPLRAILALTAVAIAAPILCYALGWKDGDSRGSALWDRLTHPLGADLSQLSTIDQYLSTAFVHMGPLPYWIWILATLCLIATMAHKLPTKPLAILLVGLGFIDMMMVVKPSNLRMPADFFAGTPAHIFELQQRAGLFRVNSSDDMPNLSSVNNSMGAWYGLQSVKGYAALRLSSYIALADEFGRDDVRDYVGVKYEIQNVQDDAGQQYKIIERPGAFPRAFLLPRYTVHADDRAAFQAFLELSPDERTAVAAISQSAADLLRLQPEVKDSRDRWQGGPAPVTVTAYENAHVQLKGRTGHPAFVVLTDMFYPGWTAYVNGISTPIVAVQGSFRGIYIPEPGNFEIDMRYEPRSFQLGAAISAGSALLVLLIAAGLLLRARSTTQSPDSDILA